MDLDLKNVPIEETDLDEDDQLEENAILKRFERYQKRMGRKEFHQRIMEGLTDEWKSFEEFDEDWPLMRSRFKPEFFDVYNKAFEDYINGDWQNAKIGFETAQGILEDSDRPCTRLLNIMKKHQYVRPSDWKVPHD